MHGRLDREGPKRNAEIQMTVLSVFKYHIKPDLMNDLLAKLATVAGSKFDNPFMPSAIRLFRSTFSGPDTGPVILVP